MVSLCQEDPSSHDGMIRITEKLIQFLPRLPDGTVQKTLIFGDQLYTERGKKLFTVAINYTSVYFTPRTCGILGT